MTDPRIAVVRELEEQLQYGVVQRNRLWEDYWREGRRMVTVPERAPAIVQQLADDLGGKINYVSPPLSDGSGFATMSFPLPKGHWIYAEGFNVPPMPFRKGTDDAARGEWEAEIRAVARYAVRASTMNGKETDFDPDAMVQNFVTGMLGYHTPNGLSSDAWANPPEDAMKSYEPVSRPFASFPNLAPKGEPIIGTSFLDTPEHHATMIARDKEISRTVDAMIAKRNVMWEPTIRACIARLKAARTKESTNRNLSTLLAVVVKVQKDLETLVGDDWKQQDAHVESQVTRDDRSL